MKWSARQSSVVFAAAMLLPFAAAPESQDRTQAHSRAVATARVDFKIVIPKVLSLEVLAGIGPGITGQTVAIGARNPASTAIGSADARMICTVSTP